MGLVVSEEHIFVSILVGVLNTDYAEQSERDEDDACYVEVGEGDDA